MLNRRQFLCGANTALIAGGLSGCGWLGISGGPSRTAGYGGGALYDPTDRRLRTDEIMKQHIRVFEDIRLNAFKGPSGMTLIGYGHAKYARMGMRITYAQAEELLEYDLRNHEAGVKRRLRRPIRLNEFSAMSALAYNVGVGAFSKSSILRRFNQGDRHAAADAFLLWNKYRKDGVLTVSQHLARRRANERLHFLGQKIRV